MSTSEVNQSPVLITGAGSGIGQAAQAHRVAGSKLIVDGGVLAASVLPA